MNKLGTVLFAMVAAALAGCTNVPSGMSYREMANPAPTSYMSRKEAVEVARSWAARKPEQRSWSGLKNTGSMLPVLDSNSVLLLEKVNPADLRVNNIAVWARDNIVGPDTKICHRVRKLEPDAVLFEGDNNQRSDGWVIFDRILWRVAGVLYTSGS